MISHFETGTRQRASAAKLVKLATAVSVPVDILRNRKNPLKRKADWLPPNPCCRWAQLVSRIELRPLFIETTLQSFAEGFRTSLTMMAIRYVELTDRATASILSRDRRVEGIFCSQRLTERGLKRSEWVIPFRRPRQR